ncbi:hypothetical protein F4804DRAFT_316206 [Jackrogersella minutella]|nr:hypothetical protein F4804DRAFT_316206 [Jackrogersella minutella]
MPQRGIVLASFALLCLACLSHHLMGINRCEPARINKIKKCYFVARLSTSPCMPIVFVAAVSLCRN